MEEKIRAVIENLLNDNGIELISVSIGEEDNTKTLFVTIDSPVGVNTDLCVKATNLISPVIDKLDLELDNYILDVGSKGE